MREEGGGRSRVGAAPSLLPPPSQGASMSLIDLSGKAALVTGGSRGIGAATAVMLAEAGASVAITYRERKAAADEVLDRIAEVGGGGPPARLPARPSISIQADVSQREDNERAVEGARAAFGRLDMFVANAGIWPPDDVAVRDMDDARWKRTLGVNLDSVFFGCRAALKVLQPGGRMVIVSSTAGQRGEAFHADYAATKGAIISFVKSLAVEAASDDITVNAVAPGWIDTEMSAGPYGRDGGAGRKAIEAGIPLGRIATAADVAGPIVFLCSELARQVTGEIVNVNGGSVLCG